MVVLLIPQLRKDGKLVKVSWEEALVAVAHKLNSAGKILWCCVYYGSCVDACNVLRTLYVHCPGSL